MRSDHLHACSPAHLHTLLGRRWKRRDYTTDATSLARTLLGTLLIRTFPDGTLLAGRIVETEAYCGTIDGASHAYRARRTARNEQMYARPGTAYVYFTYGMHYCMNIVCGEVDVPLAVLIRAVEPIAGIDTMRRLRASRPRNADRPTTPTPDRRLCSGPARLCQAFAIGREQNGLDLVSGGALFIAEPHARSMLTPIKSRHIARTPRIGIDYAGAWASKPLRFVVANSEHLSKPFACFSGKMAKPGKVRGSVRSGGKPPAPPLRRASGNR